MTRRIRHRSQVRRWKVLLEHSLEQGSLAVEQVLLQLVERSMEAPHIPGTAIVVRVPGSQSLLSDNPMPHSGLTTDRQHITDLCIFWNCETDSC